VNRRKLLRPRVVLDTNVLVSALMTPGGKPALVVDLACGPALTPCFDVRILQEYREVLGRGGFPFSPDEAAGLLRDLRRRGLTVLTTPSTNPLPDETDRPFLDVALAADAWLITGNLRHFPGVPKAVGPAEFLAKLAEGSP